MTTELRFRSLERNLRCPDRRCGRMVFSLEPDLYVGVLTCAKCGAHWWATRFQPGDVRVQLLADYDGDAQLVELLMAMFDLPSTVDDAVFWQIWLTGNELYRFNKDTTHGIRGRSLSLLRRVTSLLRAAS